MTTTGRRKLFRRKMWAVLYDEDLTPDLHWSRRLAADGLKGAFVIPGRVARVLVTEIRAGRGGRK